MNVPSITASISAANKTTIISDINAIKALLSFLINLTPQQRKSLRKMGAKRMAYVTAVMNAVLANPSAIPTGFNTAAFVNNTSLLKDLTDIYNLLITLTEGMDDSMKLVGSSSMQEADEAYGYLKTAASKSGNLALTNAVKAIAAILKHKKGSHTTPPSGPTGGGTTGTPTTPTPPSGQ